MAADLQRTQQQAEFAMGGTMKPRHLLLISIVILFILAAVTPVSADTLKLKDGRIIQGTVQRIEAGKVYVDMTNGIKTLNLAEVVSMKFTKPESLEFSAILQQLDEHAAETRRMLLQIERYWAAKQPIDAKDEPGWAAAKEEFAQPLMAYQDNLNDLYFKVLARMDEYNALVAQAEKIYVGIKGLRIGSPLVLSDMALPLRKYVPGTWYETIFRDGYNIGYADATSHLPDNRYLKQ
jgi:hypothetical protein